VVKLPCSGHDTRCCILNSLQCYSAAYTPCILLRTSKITHTHARTHTHTQPFYGSMDFVRDNLSEPYRRNIHPPTRIVVINHPLSASSIYYDPWHPPCSIHVPDSLFPQSLFKFSLVYLLAWHPPLHTPYISASNHCLLFAAHAHTIATSFAAVPRLCHLNLVSLSTLYLELYLVA